MKKNSSKIAKLCFFVLLTTTAFQAANAVSAPVLSANASQVVFAGTSSNRLSIISGSGKTSYVSGVIGDITDPASTQGILFNCSNNPTSFNLVSSNTAVVAASGLSMTLISAGEYRLKITPKAVGFSTITVVASNGATSSTYTIEYAASAGSSRAANTIFSTGISDASAAVAIDNDYVFVADDETNKLRLYSRNESGQNVYNFDITSGAAASEEMDLEGGTKASSNYNSGNRIYWIGSLGNSKSGKSKPDRNRIVATDISGTGASTTMSVKSYSTKMRAALITWGDANTWDFTTSASTSKLMIPKRIDGFNIEGLSLTHAGNAAYIGFRAPCVPVKGTTPSASNRKYAILAPVTNFEAMMNVSGNSSVAPVIGEPVLFDLAGLGIRSIERVGTSQYIIVAGLFEGGGTPVVYLWDGVVPANSGLTPISTTSASLVKLDLDLTDLVQSTTDGTVEGHPEGMFCEKIGNDIYIHIVCDNGTVDYYNAGVEAKTYTVDANKFSFAKFRTDTYIYSPSTTGCKLYKSNLHYSVANGQVKLSDLKENSHIQLIDLAGNQLVNINSTSSSMSLPLPQNSVCILNVSDDKSSQSIKLLSK